MMLSYGSSSTTIAQDYDVFMSFRGEDTRMGFTGHLYDALIRNDIRTYKDDKTLEIGKPIASELLAAIETSRIAVVVLSSNFATSKWCLEEIAKIANCMKRGNLIVIPIFYHVSPSDVRHQSNNFKQGFANHAADLEISPQKVEAWRDAFKEVGAVSGLHVTEHSVESEVVSEVVSKILSYLPDTVPVDLPNDLVGIKSRVDEVKTLMRMESSEVLFIGICGMSGVGKSTLAEAVYRDIKSEFQKCSLIENIKDISKQNDINGLCKLQQKLLDDILKEKGIHVPNVTDGQNLLGTKLHGLKVIIILDDVNHADQLIYLAGRQEWFGPGSRIIVTTTNRDLLMAHKIYDQYLCEELKPDEALSLFSQSAFEQSRPIHGYEKLSDDIVKLAGGLPLALKVYGNQLRGKAENYWKDMLEMLKEYPEEEVLGRLEVVYARLDENQRYVFIYIACFLKGRNKDLIKDILRNIGLYSERGITDLLNKSLITINVDDSVWMHDLLQQMCWKILRSETNRYDGKHIAIKSHEDTLTLNIQGAQTVEVVNQDQYKGEVNDCFTNSTCFSKMEKLKFLRISNAQFPKGLRYLSNDLRIIEWYGCSLKSLPSKFEPRHIYELEMCSSQLKTLWKKDIELPNLRSINLSFSIKLTDIPNLTSAPNLVKLNLEGCTSLTNLHESVLLHKSICYLNLKGCTCLRRLGRNLMEMEALEALVLSGCSKLEHIPEFGKNMKRLEHLYVDGTKIKRLPENMGQLYDLRNFDASGTLIQELPSSISRLKKLRVLHVNNCCRLSFKTGCFLNHSLDTLSSGLKEVDLSYCNLSVVPDGIGLLCHLITLNLSGNEFVSLPASIGLLSKLRVLFLNNCKRLQSLPKLSLVDEDMDYGPRGRFNYYVSTKEVDVPKFDALSVNHRPTVLCLNCSKLALDKRGSCLAVKILNNYLELRRLKYWMTPEAVFQIVGVGSEFPAGFEDPSNGGISLTGPWIGVAVCAVISAHHVDAYMKANHMVTACVFLGDKHMKIPVPIKFLEAGSETQIILYWTIADDLQRIAGSNYWGIFDVSFDLEPDSNLHVTKVGVRIIHEEYVMCVMQDVDSKIMLWKRFPIYTFFYKEYVDAYTANANLYPHTHKILNFIVEYGSQHDSLIGIFQITKDLLEINQKILRILCEDQIGGKDKRFDYFDYATISLGVSALYKDFVRSLKDMNDGWLTVKLALENFVVKSRAGIYSYEEMKHHLNDLDATQSIEFSDNVLEMFLLVCMKTFDFFHSVAIETFNQELAGTSSIPVTCGIYMLTLFMGGYECLKEIQHITGRSRWEFLCNTFTDMRRQITVKTNYRCELQISDFCHNRVLLQQLTNKMGRSSCFTEENEEEMMSVIDKLQSNIHKVSSIIQEMSSHADQYSHDIKMVKKFVKSFSKYSKDDEIISMLHLFNTN